jgi:hypothetical protein
VDVIFGFSRKIVGKEGLLACNIECHIDGMGMIPYSSQYEGSILHQVDALHFYEETEH